MLNNRKLKLQIEIFRINKQKTCTYQFRKITLKNYQIISKNHEFEYEQTRTLYKPQELTKIENNKNNYFQSKFKQTGN